MLPAEYAPRSVTSEACVEGYTVFEEILVVQVKSLNLHRNSKKGFFSSILGNIFNDL